MKILRKNIPVYILFLFYVFLSGITVFTLFRLILLFTESKQLAVLPGKFYLLSNALLIGLRFDTAVSGYILLLPCLLLCIAYCMKWEITLLYRMVGGYTVILYLTAFLICSADIPYFNYFFHHINVSVFNWFSDAGFVMRMIFQEKSYFIFILLFLIFSVSFIAIIKKTGQLFLKVNLSPDIPPEFHHVITRMIVSLLVLGLIFLGIRGRIAVKSPIRIGTAFFSNYAFPNQLGLNPVFVFIRSFLDAQNPQNRMIQLMDEQSAIVNVKHYFKIDTSEKYDSPIARHFRIQEGNLKHNVVLVIMEGMSANYMKRYDRIKNLTPHLDSIARLSYCFDNVYSAGIHTMNGIFSTLFSFPALLQQHPMKTVDMPQFQGLPNTLKEHGYRTIYFTTHDDQFDNVGGFLMSNGFDKIISQSDYPSEKVMSILGVPDDYMFEFAIPVLNGISADSKPFFAVFLTASNHDPVIIPDNSGFQPHFKDDRLAIVEYSDWAIGKFISVSANQTWFNNTIFVFIADHGGITGANLYEIPLSCHHVPLIMFSPGLLSPESFSQTGGQIDVSPTIMGILNLDYINSTMGIDLLREKRPYIYFSSGDKIGCLDRKYFYIYNMDGRESLFNYSENDPKNYLTGLRGKADSMKAYCFSMMQTAQTLITNQKTGY